MPLYPYECGGCGHAFDELQSVTEKPLRKCPECGKRKLRRLFGVPNAIVRGNPRCIGQLAEENTRELVKKHGKEGAQRIIREKSYGSGGKKLKLPKGGKLVPRPTETEIPWFRSGEVPGTGERMEKPLDLTKIKDPAKYARTGEKD